MSTDPFREGQAEDLLPDAAALAAEAAAQARQEADEIEQAAVQKAAKEASQKLEAKDSDAFISPDDLGFLNGK